MSRVLITGSADGLGQMAARLLIADGHDVVLHARSPARAKDALAGAPGASAVLTGDLSSIEETKRVAEQANETGRFDAIIHNAGVADREQNVIRTADGLANIFAVNVLAPYLLTALVTRPDRLVYIGSDLHRVGDTTLQDLQWERRDWNGWQAYADTKLHLVLLAFGVARRWPKVYSNVVEPGWVATKLGGPDATGDMEEGPRTQAWLAASDDPAARVTGGNIHHRRPQEYHPAANDPATQDALLDACAELTGISLK